MSTVTAFDPIETMLIDPEKNARHTALHKFLSEEAKPFFDQVEAPADIDYNFAEVVPKPQDIDEAGIQGRYVGMTNMADILNGPVSLLSPDERSLWQGFFKQGKRHGASRLIKMCMTLPAIKIVEGVYEEGEPVGTFKSTKVFNKIKS